MPCIFLMSVCFSDWVGLLCFKYLFSILTSWSRNILHTTYVFGDYDFRCRKEGIDISENDIRYVRMSILVCVYVCIFKYVNITTKVLKQNV